VTERIFLVGYYGVDNLGDDAIFEAIERAARQLGVEIVRFACRGPSDDPRAVPVRGFGIWRYLRAIVEADRVVLGGGGILKDESLQLPLELLATAVVARLLRRPVTLLAVGVGPLYTRLGRRLVAAVGRLAGTRTVRDEASRRLLTELGVSRVERVADPIFIGDETAAPAAGASGDGDQAAAAPGGEARQLDADRPSRLVVAIRPWFLDERGVDGPRRSALRRAVAAAVQPLVDAGWQVTFAGLHWPRDAEESRRLVEAAGWSSSVAVAEGPLDWHGLGEVVADADLVIAMRYHAVAAAALADRRTIALAYESKVQSLAEDLGLHVVAVDDPELAAWLGATVARLAALPAGDTAGRPATGSVAALSDRAWRGLAVALRDPVVGRRPG
jgi:polysaccharide pyruvyl transferase CsaB